MGCGGLSTPPSCCRPSPGKGQMGATRTLRLSLLGCLLLTPRLHGQEAAACPSGWVSFEEGCYGFFPQELSWRRAEAFCRRFGVGTHLASVHSEEEHGAIATMLSSSHPAEGSEEGDKDNGVWIGLHRPRRSKYWQWSDGSEVDYGSWHQQEHGSRRRVCAALQDSTGYHLHDPSRNRAPAYSFGVRAGGQQPERSPGPAYLVPPGTTTKGKDGIPAYSIHGRPHDLPPFRTPGPGCYSPERAGRLTLPCAPACSLRSRGRQFTTEETPVWGGCHRSLCPQTPGPCGYRLVDANVYKQRAPKYSMAARNYLPGDNTLKPGPGTYTLEQGRQRGQTFGIRHSNYLVPLIVDVLD
ncbi:PREDICTED: outer dense fiber protein 3B [Calidris pugnax]|uniref:outer dense fiber protein 3B n=1 Tax=Calidris pugnax TaxID=198806 RepID=UPI00071DF0FE|nr:PREDICTED: outer dense fiber protein 3B [Calidris pugnax]